MTIKPGLTHLTTDECFVTHLTIYLLSEETKYIIKVLPLVPSKSILDMLDKR